MASDSDNETSIEGQLDEPKDRRPSANWGKAKYDYYFTDYVDKDYPSSLSRKEEKQASLEQEEAQRIQRKLHSKLDDVNLQPIIDTYPTCDEDVIEFLAERNKLILSSVQKRDKKRIPASAQNKEVDDYYDDDEEDVGDENDEDDDDDDDDEEEDESQICEKEPINERRRRPINMTMKKNRGLTPYKKKEYRNPRVKHKLKYQKAATKRRRLVKEAQTEFYRYSGESTGIKTSTVKSIKLC